MKYIFSLLLALGLVNIANAEGNADAGKAKSALCAGCHGVTGTNLSPTYPDLAGQHAAYIAKQLQAFKDGSRKDPLMAPMVSNLSAQDMADLGAYFASQARGGDSSAANSEGSAAVAQTVAKHIPDAAAGKSLYELGDASRSIGACIGWHGKDGNSDVLIYPNLAKQHPEYIVKQLNNFKSETRTNNYAMNQFTAALTDNEMANIAAYFADTTAVANIVVRQPVAVVAPSDEAIAGQEKVATCAACHGADGNSLVAMYPKLAGQNAKYLAKQLHEFKDGTRDNAIMAPMAAALSAQDITDISAFYSTQLPTASTAEINELGRKLYLGGDAARGVTACIACHGIDGKGMAYAGFPAIAGQNTDYLVAQLNSFKSKERDNDKNSMMRKTVRKLKKADIDALSQYMSTLK